MTASLFPEENAPHRNSDAEWIVAHCDGGSRGNPGPAGCGAYITTAKGEPLAELSNYLGKRTNNYAEYSALLAALEWALKHNHPRLRVVADSELMVKQMQGRYQVKSPDLRPLWEEARRRAAQLESFRIDHVLRNKNKEADRLANEAMDRGMGRAPQGNPSATGPVVATFSTASASQPKAGPVLLRGFVKGGVVHLLGGAELPDGTFVKVLCE
jgi:probable phosphoglycerate mutase